MKKRTKNLILVMFLVIAMFGSTFAYILIGGIAPPPQPEQPLLELPAQFVFQGSIEPEKRFSYIAQGITILEFHYTEGCCTEDIAAAETLPANFDFQVLVEEIQGTRAFTRISSFRAEVESNSTSVESIYKSLCSAVLRPPPECGLLFFNSSR